jgi:Transferase family
MRRIPFYRSFRSTTACLSDAVPKTLIRRRRLVAPGQQQQKQQQQQAPLPPASIAADGREDDTEAAASRNDEGKQYRSHDEQDFKRGAVTMTVPLTLADYHLRNEQLPFGFFFQEALDQDQLEMSLWRVLQHFPVVAGRLSDDQLDIECRLCDTVPFSAGNKGMTLSDWLHRGDAFPPSTQRHRNHIHESGEGHPALLDIFDSLFPVDSVRILPDLAPAIPLRAARKSSSSSSLLSVRVTHFTCGGTAVGVNWNHALGDTSSLLHFVQCWGREMRDRRYDPSYSNVRSDAACSGMSRHFEDVLTVDAEATLGTGQTPLLLLSSYFDSMLTNLGLQVALDVLLPRDVPASTPHQY